MEGMIVKIKDIAVTDEFGEIVQIGIVVKDLEKVQEGMLEVFGLEPDAGGEFLYKGCIYKGSDTLIDAPVLSSFYNFFNIQLEFLQPIGEQNLGLLLRLLRAQNNSRPARRENIGICLVAQE